MYVNDNYDYRKVNQKETLIKIEFYAVIVTVIGTLQQKYEKSKFLNYSIIKK